MRRVICMFASVGLLLGLACHARAGDEALAIVEKAMKAHLGGQKEKKRLAYQGKNKGTLFIGGMELEFTQNMSIQSPDKFKEVMEMTVNNQRVLVTTVFNGKEGWVKANDMDIKVDDDMLKEFKEAAYAMGLGQMSAFKDKSIKLSLIGEVQVNGKPAVGVTVSKEGKRDIAMYFDKATGLTAKIERRARDFMSGQEVNEERIITEYQDVEGRKMPKKVVVNRDGNKLLEAEVVELRFVERLDDSEFARP